jgi:hypothetical protein
MLLKDALNVKKFDRRLVDRSLAEGKITKTEHEKMMKELPDDSSNFTTTDSWLEKRRADRMKGHSTPNTSH